MRKRKGINLPRFYGDELDFFEFRSDEKIIRFGKGIPTENKKNSDMRRVLQIEEQTK